MRYLFISDFHLGSPLFSNEYELIKILTSGYDKIFLVGDIIDELENDVDITVFEYNTLISIINKLDNVIIVKGNHDPGICDLRIVFPKAWVCDEYIDDFGVVVHGDKFDKFLDTFLQKISFKIFYVCERVGLNTKMIIRHILYNVISFIKGKSKNDLIVHYEIDAFNYYCKEHNNIISGHSHMPKIVSRDGCNYINCGDWIYNKTYVEYVDGEFKLLGV